MRSLAALGGLGLLVAAATCKQDPATTGVVVEVSTNLGVPDDLDEVRVVATAAADRNAVLYERSFPLGDGAGTQRSTDRRRPDGGRGRPAAARGRRRRRSRVAASRSGRRRDAARCRGGHVWRNAGQVAGCVGPCFDLMPQPTDYLRVPPSASLNAVTQEVTFAAVVNGSAAATPAASLPPARMNHLAATYDGNIARLYVAGTMAGEFVIGPQIILPSAGTTDLYIAAEEVGPGTAGNFLGGQLDQVMIYNRALSPEEIALLATGTYPPKMY